MRFYLAAPPLAVVALGAGLLVFARHGSVTEAVLIGASSGLLAGLVVLLTTEPLLARLRALALSARGAAEGNWVERADALGGDEMASIGQSLNRLTDRYRESFARMSTDTRTLIAVLDGMAEAVWITDEEGTLVLHNAALARMLPRQEPLIGHRPLSLIRDNALHEAVLRACAKLESSRLEVLIEGSPPRTMSVQVAPLARDLPGSAAVFHDVTELRRLEKIRKDFVANVSHELRTPITAIRGYAETLKAGALKDPEHAPKMVDIIHRQSERLSQLVEDLLEISRLESKTLTLQREPLVLATLAQRALEGIRPRAEEKGLTLRLQIPAELTALGDERALEQVLVNLLDNAVKYTPPNGSIVLSGSREGQSCALAIRDTGVGIEAQHLSRIFERFYRVDKGRSREMGGTGLGLSIVKHLLTTQGGDIRVQSEPGSGSTFTVLLPSAAPAS